MYNPHNPSKHPIHPSERPSRVCREKEQSPTSLGFTRCYTLTLMTASLKRQADLEGLDEGVARVVDADDAEEHAEEDDEAVEGHGAGLHRVALELEVEVAGPDEGEHGAGEGADEAHEDAEVRYEDGHEDGEENDTETPSKAPDLELAVERPDRREKGLGLAPEQGTLEEFAGRVVGQRIREHGLHH